MIYLFTIQVFVFWLAFYLLIDQSIKKIQFYPYFSAFFKCLTLSFEHNITFINTFENFISSIFNNRNLI
jgi:hypothetical protein